MESQVNASGASGMDGGAGDAESQESVQKQKVETADEKVVKYNDHKKALDDMHRFKKEAAEAKAKLDEFKQSQLKEKEDYKTLWEQERALREEAVGGLEQFKKNYVENEKWSAVEKEFRKLGIDEGALEILRNQPLEGVETELTSHGRILVHGADTLAESWKKKFPFAFKSKSTPKFNSGGAGDTTSVNGRVSAADVLKAEQEAKRNPAKKQAYYDMLKRFAEQQKK